MEIRTEQSKSQFFSVKDGKTIFTELQAGAEQPCVQPCVQPSGIIDEKYQITQLLGEGGMGAVFRARHLMLNKDVALKTFRSPERSEEAVKRFQREAQALAKLSHKNVVQVFDYGFLADGAPYYTMEFLEGQSLADRIREKGPLEVGPAVGLFVPVCHGLEMAHSKGIIHRDLKPSNLFIDKSAGAKSTSETIKIVDFGLASLTNQSVEVQQLTASGAVFGSPLYMSPEQSLGATIARETDIYSLGCTLFEALTGIPPFRGQNALETIMMHQLKIPPSLKEGSGGYDFPPAMETLIGKMLAKTPDKRPQSMNDVAAQLSALSGTTAASGSKITFQNSVPATAADKPQAAAGKSFGPATITGTGEVRTDLNTHNKQRLSSRRPGQLVMAMLGLILITVTVFEIYASGHLSRRISKNSALPKSTESNPVLPAQPFDAVNAHIKAIRRQASSASGHRYVSFKVPNDLVFGSFDPRCLASRDRWSETYRWQAEKAPIFRPSTVFLSTPTNFALFKPYDLSGVCFADCNPDLVDSKVVDQLCRMSELQTLDLSGCKHITIAEVDKLLTRPHLEMLSLNNTDISGDSLAKLPALKKIPWLRFSKCKGADKVIIALKGSPKLVRLQMNRAGLRTEDLKAIAAIPNLEIVNITYNGLKISDLEYLLKLKKLKTLFAGDCRVTPSAAGILKRYRQNGLRMMELSAEGLTKADQDTLTTILPGLEFKPLPEPAAEKPQTDEYTDLAKSHEQ